MENLKSLDKSAINELSNCIINNTPNPLERHVVNALRKRYELSEAAAFTFMRKFYGFDNVLLANILTQLFSKKRTKDLQLLDSMVSKQLLSRSCDRDPFLVNFNKRK
jgi:hypothetical protein